MTKGGGGRGAEGGGGEWRRGEMSAKEMAAIPKALSSEELEVRSREGRGHREQKDNKNRVMGQGEESVGS